MNTIGDGLFTAQFDFDQTVGTVPQMDNGITYQPAFVPVVKDGTVQFFRVDTQIAHAEIFEKETCRVEIIEQIIRPKAQSGCCD